MALAIAGALAWTHPTFAQGSDNGTVVVRVMDPDDTPMQGVEVTIDGPLGARRSSTDGNGTARFPALYPSPDYMVTFARAGYGTLVREGLRVSVGRTLTLRVAMEQSAGGGPVIDARPGPVVDLHRAALGATVDAALIDAAPTASGIWAGVLDHVPGIVTDEFDVGGGESDQQPVFSARGSGWGQNTYNLNGANTIDPDALGSASLHFSAAAFEEVRVSTGAHDIEVRAPGVVLDMVTKAGGDSLHGGARGFFEGRDFVDDNVDERLERLGVTSGNPQELLSDLNLQLGGPVVSGRAWLFVDWWRFAIERRILAVPGEIDDTLLKNWTLNGTWQINETHRVSGRYFTDRKFRGNRGVSRTTPPESAWIQDSFVDIPQLQWLGLLGADTFAELRWSKMDMDFPLLAKSPDSPRPHPRFDGSIAPRFDLTTRTWTGPPNREVFFQRDRNQLNGSVSHYLAGDRRSHDLRLGGEFARTQAFTPDRRGHTFGYEDLRRSRADGSAPPERVRLWNSPRESIFEIAAPNGPTDRGESWALFVLDSFTLENRLALSVGVRLDRSRTYVPEQLRPDSFWAGQPGTSRPDLFAAGTRSALGNTSEWSNLVPRISVVYDVSGSGRTAAKATFARYAHQQGTTFAGLLNANTIGSESWFWTDANGDDRFQLGENTVFTGASFPGVTTRIDPDLSSPIVTEWSLGVEHELFENFLASITGIYRDTGNIVEDVNVGRPYGPLAASLGVQDVYTPVTVTDPGPDGILGTADDQGQVTVFNRNAGAPGNLFFITNPDKFGFDPFSEYRGVSLLVHKRWSDSWQLLASWDIGEATSSVAGASGFGTATAFDDPNSDLNRAGRTPWDRTHVVKITGNTLVPEPIGMNFGAFLRLHSGQPLVRDFLVVGLNQGAISPHAAPPGEDSAPAPEAELPAGGRFDTVSILDLRAEKRFTLPGRYGVLHVYLDWFNVTNANTIWAMGQLSGPAYGRVDAIVPPRVFRLGGAWDF